MTQFKTKIISNKKIAPNHFLLSFKTPKVPKPGQFFNIRISNSYEPLLRRPFSAHKIEKGRVEILYKVVGKATKILSTKKKGDILDIIGPLGNGFNTNSLRGMESVILVGGSHGIAPLYALAKKLKTSAYAKASADKYNLRLITFIGARTKKHIICDEDFKRLRARVYIATDDGSKGYKGLVTDLLRKKLRVTTGTGLVPTLYFLLKDLSPQEVAIYACGPKAMLKQVARLTKQYKIPCQVSLEEYMACGIGTCLGCVVKTQTGYKLVCKDGPVFDSKEIIWH